MGCSSSTAADKQHRASRASSLARLQARRSSQSVACFPQVEDDDDVLASMDLPLNEDLEEDKPLTADEKNFLTWCIVEKLKDRDAYECLDETSKVRLFRGMVVNNSGTEDEKTAEAIEAFDRIGAWLQADGAGILATPRDKEEVVNATMNTVLGGEDLYGHLVWAERLGDVHGLVDHPVSVPEIKAVRLKLGEIIRAAQIQKAERRGPRRYKQVYIVDLSQLSISSLMGSSKCREMAKSIIGGAGDYFPETLWKLFIVNAPFIFRSAYGIVSPFIHPVTKEKIQILGGKSAYLAALKKAGVLPAAIPKSLGGTHPDVPLKDALADLIADGFPRGAKKWEVAEGEEVSVRAAGALAPVPEDAEEKRPSRASFAAAAVAVVAFAGVAAWELAV